jgi:Ca2+-binding RTX toxin-like protein
MAAIRGTSKKDRLNGTASADTIYGLGGSDTLRGKSGNDTLSGGTGSDELFGGRGKDSLKGGTGNDTLDGGQGSDTIIGGSGLHDTVTYASTKAAARNTFLTVEDVTGQLVQEIFNGVFVDLRTGTARELADRTRDSISGVEDITGTAGADLIFGNDQDNIIRTGGSARGVDRAGDWIVAGGGDDTIIMNYDPSKFSVLNQDNYFGGTGNDTIVGLGMMYGEDGNDIIRALTFPDAFSNQFNLLDAGAGDDVLIGSASHFEILTGGLGNDVLNGGRGRDTMVGGTGGLVATGSDRFIFDDGDGFDSFSAGGGFDDQIFYFHDGFDTLDLSAVDSGTAHLVSVAANGSTPAGVQVYYGTGSYSGYSGVFYVADMTLATLTQSDFIGVILV